MRRAADASANSSRRASELMFRKLRMQPEQLGVHADVTIAALTDLVSYAAGHNQD